MIELYTGTPGSGKSLHLAQKIKNWLSIYNAPVICNFEFRADLCRMKKWAEYIYIDNSDLTTDFLIWFSEYYKGLRGWERVPEETILLVIDECQLIFNCRAWNDKRRPEWISFFTQHRKLGYRVILVAQFEEMIDKQVRALIEYEYVHRKVKNIGLFGKVFNAVALGGLHVAVKIYKPLRDRCGSDFFKSDPNLYCLYDSYTRFGSADP